MKEPVKDLLLEKRVLCTVGSGGVGKTTCAAALGMMASVLGRRVLVLTIDPAKRLASAMGLGDLGLREEVISVERMRALGIPAQEPLAVKMLDLKASWDDMVRRLSSTPEAAHDILGNRFYQYLSTELAGAQEYIACEHLFTMSYERAYDLVVLDTPPTANALDFLDAPDRILGILNHDAVRIAARPALVAGKLSLKLFDMAGGAAMKAMEKLTGVETLKELSEFLLLFEQLFDPIKTRTEAVQRLLTSDGTSFVLVASPEMGPLAQARYFLEHLERMSLPVGCVVVNRVRRAPPAELDAPALERALRETGATGDLRPLLDATRAAVADAQRLVAREASTMAPLLQAAGTAPLLRLPRLGDDVHDLAGLWALGQRLMVGAPAGG
ncbi:MAG: ArsA family ATPase [Deltaproteobacteria bacterium]|nr:ArsA family ATPase [Deltaproteobacteria bacterium]